MSKLETLLETYRVVETPLSKEEPFDLMLKNYEELRMRFQYASVLVRKVRYDAVQARRRRKFFMVKYPFDASRRDIVPLLKPSRGFLGRLRDEKTVYSIPLSYFKAELPNQILEVAVKNQRDFDDLRVWLSCKPSQLNQYVLQRPINTDPVLVGVWHIKQLIDYCVQNIFECQGKHGCPKAIGCCEWHRCANSRTIGIYPYSAVLGMWGDDLEEIDLAVRKTNHVSIS